MGARPVRKRSADYRPIGGEVLDVRFSHLRLLLDGLEARVATVEVKVDRLRAELRALPDAIAEMLDEREKRRS
jgi:hypothetical protein